MRLVISPCIFAFSFLGASAWELPESFPFLVIDPHADELILKHTPLASGSWGEMYKAVRKDNGELVVLNVPHDGKSIGGRMSSVATGCKLLQSLNIGPEHHLMSCLEYVHIPPPGYAVFDFGGRNGLAVASTVGPHAVQQLAKQLFLSLAFLAQASPPLVHMDVKWDNTAVDSQMCLKLIDADDLWKGTVGHSQTGGKVHTPKFAPRDVQIDGGLSFYCGAKPENKGDGVCPHAFAFDVYSAGVSMMSFMCGVAEAELVSRCVNHGATRTNCLQKLYSDRYASEVANWGQEGVLFMNVINALEDVPLFHDAEELHKYFVDDPAHLMLDASLKHGELASSFSEEVKQFEQKQQHCVKLFTDPGTREALLGAVIADAEKRWSPKKVLESPLFKELSTGCALDGSVNDAQAYLDQRRAAAQSRLAWIAEGEGSKSFQALVPILCACCAVGVIISLVFFARRRARSKSELHLNSVELISYTKNKDMKDEEKACTLS